MRPVRQLVEGEVWDHWQCVEDHQYPSFRSDIRDALPTNLIWFLCEVQPEDVDRIFIISSDDWTDISGGTFRVSDVAHRVDLPSSNADTNRLAGDIRGKLNHLDSGGQLDQRLIGITDSPSLFGPFTLIEGNRRSAVFYRRNLLVGSLIFVGYSPLVVDCTWTRHTYRLFKQSRSVFDS